MSTIEHVGVLGAGVIGASWTALFLAAGKTVSVYDPDPNVEKTVRDYVERTWPTLESLGMTQSGNPDAVRFFSKPESAVEQAQFVQESVPEKLDIKYALYNAIEDVLEEKTLVASSASGLMLSEMQKGWKNPRNFLLGHPFNPPHLIPLVELLTNSLTDKGVMETAEQFYQSVGKVTIRVKREVPAHVANRLQAALWREAIYLVQSGVASVEDVDKAVWSGPGLRWAAMGPHMLFNLGAGEGGINEFCNRYKDSFHRWWDDLGNAELTPEVAAQLAEGVIKESDGQDFLALSAQRDELIEGMLRVTRPIREASES